MKYTLFFISDRLESSVMDCPADKEGNEKSFILIFYSLYFDKTYKFDGVCQGSLKGFPVDKSA